MPCHLIRSVSAAATLALVFAAPARAQEAPKPRTITVTECVEEKYQEKRTCYRVECRAVEYDTFRCENVCEQRERTCTVVKRIPVHTIETRKVACKTWAWENRVVMKPCYEYQQVTKNVKKCVSKGHWECRTECAKPCLLERLCSHGACKDDCGHGPRKGCDDCGRTVTKKVWVHCPVYVDCPVTSCVKVCVPKPTVCKVKVGHTTYKEVQVPVCRHQCVQEQVTQRYVVNTVRHVPCKAVRYERVCTPYEETVWCTRLVPRTREVQVAETPCVTECCTPCRERCPRACGGLRFREQGCCH